MLLGGKDMPLGARILFVFKDYVRHSYAKALLVAIALFMIVFVFDWTLSYETIASLLSTNEPPKKQLLKVVFFCIMLLATHAALLSCLLSRTWFYLGCGFVFLGVLDKIFESILKSKLSAAHIGTAAANLHFASDFVRQYWLVISIPLLLSLTALLFFSAVRKKFTIYTGTVLFFVLVSTVMNYVFLAKAGDHRPALSIFNVPFALFEYSRETSIPYSARSIPTVGPTAAQSSPEIVMYIVDESINYTALKTIDSLILDSQKMSTLFGASTISYRAHSASNHSATANYILRNECKSGDFPDVTFTTIKSPTIFSYAKAAGYKVIFYDAQTESGRLQNMMSRYDLAGVDYFLSSFPQTKRHERDKIALERIRVFLDSERSAKWFVYLVKHGAHFPYINSINCDEIEPHICDCHYLTDTRCIENQYMAAVKHSVDSFMKRLSAIVYGRNFALVYTSDHGQNISKAGEMPHGSTQNISENEILVPIVFTGECFSKFNPGRVIASHFDLFPAVKWLLGYELSQDETKTEDEDCNKNKFIYDPFVPSKCWLSTTTPFPPASGASP